MRFSPPLDLTPFSGFIFDCDGTLADTMVLHFRAWRRALREGGARFEFDWDTFLSRAGMSMEKTVEELAVEFDEELDPLFVATRQRAVFASMEGQVVGIEEVLSFAKRVAVDFKVAVASGSSRSSVERSLASIGALDLFQVIVTPEDVERGKPDPDMFLLAASRIGVAPERCLVVEDGALGIEAARRANMQCAIVAPSLAPTI